MRRLFPLFMGMLLAAGAASAAHGQTRGGFDVKGHLLMHGTPRFMLGVFDSGGGYAPAPSHWEDQIFSPTGSRGLQGFPLNLYLNYQLGNMPIDSTNALLDVLGNHGMMYLQTGNCYDTGSWRRPGLEFSIMSQTYVQQYALHSAALGYYTMDECVDALIAETEAHEQELKTWDPQGITFATTVAAGYRDPSLWKNAADVLGTDPYPLYGLEPDGPEPAVGYTHFIVADFVSKLRAVAKPSRPIWSVLQLFKFTTDSRMPTPEEMRAHAVMSIVEGAQGIFWWDIGVNGLRSLDAATVSTYMGHLKTLTTELAGLEPVLLADSTPGALVGNSTTFADPIAGRKIQLRHNLAVEWLYSRIQWYQAELDALQAGDTSKSGGMLIGAANVRTLTKVVGGVGYVFAYNYTNSSRPVTFTWQSAPTGVKESQTGQAFTLNGASWSDTFAPYQSRIYIVTGAGSPPLSASFTTPATAATVTGTATVGMASSGASGSSTFVLAVDGTVVSTQTVTGASTAYAWNTATVANGSRALTLTVTDGTARSATASLGVTVGNTTVRDFDGDGKADILWRDTSGALNLWRLSGTSVVGTGAVGGVDTEWTVVGVGDFNGDGKADILWRNPAGVLALWFMNATTIIGHQSTGTLDLSWSIAAVTDVNGDGKADIVWRHSSGPVVIWLMDGAIVIGRASLGTIDPAWTLAAVGDVNGDGKADILWRHTNGNTVIWLLDGSSVIAAALLGGVSTDWVVQGLADIDADGKADIVWRQASTGVVAIWFMNGVAVSGTGGLGAVGTDWQIQGIADFNGDGRTDILWRHTSGNAAIWLMNGTSVIGAGGFSGVSTSWRIQ